MSDERLDNLTIAQAAGLIRQGDISPVALAEAYLARIAYLNPRLNAFLTVLEAGVLREARLAAEALRRGENWGPLHGIPVGVKDLIDVAGAPTTAGSDFLRDNVAAEDASVVRRLRAAGALIIGKTHLHEFAIGATTINPHYGPARNPWNPDFSPGGSSGGSAAAVAAGVCAGALGTDTGGSVRTPSALCGLTGLRPAIGQVSMQGVIPMSWTLDTVGPMAHNAEDAALLFDALDEQAAVRHADSLGTPGHAVAAVEGLRLGLPVDGFFWDETDIDIVAAVRTAADQLAGLGLRVVEVNLPGAQAALEAAGLIGLADAAAYHRERLAEEPGRFGLDVRARLEHAASRSAADYAQARQTGREWRETLGVLFDGTIDVLATPTTPTAGHLIEGSEGVAAARQLLRFTYPISLSALPALSMPCGFSRDGLPIGMQLVAPEAGRLLCVAHAYQQVTDWHTHRPAM